MLQKTTTLNFIINARASVFRIAMERFQLKIVTVRGGCFGLFMVCGMGNEGPRMLALASGFEAHRLDPRIPPEHMDRGHHAESHTQRTSKVYNGRD